MTRSLTARYSHLIGVCVIAVFASGLYFPFFGNPAVFDDAYLFSGSNFAYYATHPFGFELRVPPYFTFAVAQVLSGRMEVHRVMNLVLHVACSLVLYKLIYDLLRAARAPGVPTQAPDALPEVAIASVSAAAFALHPVAVYGAGYLVQRSIVLATLFSLLSIVLFVRGLRRSSHADAVSAGLLYALAVLCKEHSVLLPAAAVLTVPLVASDLRFAVRHTAIYWATCAPAAILVVFLRGTVVGEAYEPYFDGVAAQIEGAFGRDIGDFPWPLSVVTQAGLFFRYVSLWLWPDTGGMSIDLRVDFLETWSPGWILLKMLAFASWGAIGFVLLRRRGRAGLVGLGMLYTWVLFLIEFGAARFQEPFVLYRSYLWAPGILVALAAVLGGLPLRATLVAFAITCPVLLYQAHDRLVTFSHPLVLWEDAVAKLPAAPIPWGSRTLFNLAREYVYVGRPDRAIAVTERCLAQYPNTYHCHFARGAIYLQLEEFEHSLPDLRHAIELRPDSGIAHHRLGLALEHLGRIEEARTHYRRASALEFGGADQELLRLESPGAGLLPPGRRSQ